MWFFQWSYDDVIGAEEPNTMGLTVRQVETLYKDVKRMVKTCDEVKDMVHEKVIKIKEKNNALHMEEKSLTIENVTLKAKKMVMASRKNIAMRLLFISWILLCIFCCIWCCIS